MSVRERPFHYQGGGWKTFFSADYFFQLILKLEYIFTHHLKTDFFHEELKVRFFFKVMFQAKDIHTPSMIEVGDVRFTKDN